MLDVQTKLCLARFPLYFVADAILHTKTKFFGEKSTSTFPGFQQKIVASENLSEAR